MGKRYRTNTTCRQAGLPPIMMTLILVLLASGSTGAEQTEPLITDRPDFTESAASVPLKSWQFEFGYTYEKDDLSTNHSLGELLVRVSFFKNLEFRVGLNSFRIFKTACCADRAFEDMALGVKWAPVPGRVALLVGTSVPTGGGEFRSNKLQPEIKLALAQDISRNLSLGANVGYGRLYEAGVAVDELSGSLSLAISLSDRAGLYLEYFCFFMLSEGESDRHFLNGGLTYLITPVFQLDLRYGRLLSSGDTLYFIGAGATLRI